MCRGQDPTFRLVAPAQMRRGSSHLGSGKTRAREVLLAGDHKPLVNYEHQLGSEAELAVPTSDHHCRCFRLLALARHPSRSRFLLRV